MYKIGIIFSLYILTPIAVSTNSLNSLSAPQSRLLDSFKPCINRMVFLENYLPASEDVFLFLNLYRNQATFILESIPFDSRKFVNTTIFAESHVEHMRFITCYSCFFFQDQIYDALSTSKIKLRPIKLLIYDYFTIFTVKFRNENPTSVIFINFKNSIVGSHYSGVGLIGTTSTFYIIAFNDQYPQLICACATCQSRVPIEAFSESLWRRYHIGTQIPVHNLRSTIWDTESVNSDSCGISPHQRFTLRSPTPGTICFFHEMKKHLNITDSLKKGFRSEYTATFYPVNKINHEFFFKKNSILRNVLLSHGMSETGYQFGSFTRAYEHSMISLIKPFDILTWCFIIFSFLNLCLYLRISFWITNHRTLSETHVFSILMEQSQDIVTDCRSLQKKTCGLLAIWLLLVFLVGNAYEIGRAHV